MGTFQQIKGQEPTDPLMNLEKKKKRLEERIVHRGWLSKFGN